MITKIYHKSKFDRTVNTEISSPKIPPSPYKRDPYTYIYTSPMSVKNSTIRKLIVVTMIFFSLSKRLKRRKVVVNLISHTWLNVVKNKVCLS